MSRSYVWSTPRCPTQQTRTRTQRVITKGTDFFTRELAFALDEAITEHEASMH